MPGPDGRDESVDGDVPFRPMSISEMLDGAIAGIRSRPRTTLGLSVAFSTVIQVAGSIAAFFYIGDEATGEVTPDALMRSVGAQFVLGAIGLILTAYGVLVLAGLLAPLLGRGLLGLPVPPRQAWRDARPSVPRLAAVAAVVMAAALVALLLPIAPFVLLVADGEYPVLGVIAAIIGFPLGLGLMVWLYVLLVLAAPAVVLERETVSGALRRAWTLSRGRWLRTCGTLLLALLITVFMGYFALRIPFLVVQLIFFGDATHGTGLVLGLAVDTVGRIVSWSIVLPFDAGVIALLYIDRRMRREGFDLDLRTRRLARRTTGTPATAATGAAADGAPGNGNGAQTNGGAGEDLFEIWRPAGAASAHPAPEPEVRP